jgi:predicted Zn-dependent peptidase
MSLKIAVQLINQPGFFSKKALEHSLNKATSLSFEYVKGYFHYDILIVSIVCSSANNRIDSEKIWGYLKNKMHNANISKANLDVVKRQELISMAYKKDDIKKISEYFGWMLSFGYSIAEIQSVDEIIQSITVDECAEVLKEVLMPHPIGVLRVVPKGYDRD